MRTLLISLFLIPASIFSCEKCDEVYTYVMCAQYKMSNEHYYLEDKAEKKILEAKLEILTEVRKMLEDKKS